MTAGEVIWHDTECGGYEADLGSWGELAREAEGPVLDLGCGTGRVGLWLARRGHEVIGVDVGVALVDEFNRRAGGLPASAVVGDARELALGRKFALVLAPMQVIQLLAGGEERAACLRGVGAHLEPGGVAALAIVEDLESAGASLSPEGLQERPDAPSPLPDTREVDGRVYSSLPLPPALADGAIVVRRLRQTVSVEGRLEEEEDRVQLRPLTAPELEREAAAAGFEPLSRRAVLPTDDHVGSTVVVLRKGGS